MSDCSNDEVHVPSVNVPKEWFVNIDSGGSMRVAGRKEDFIRGEGPAKG